MQSDHLTTRERDHFWWMHPAFRGEQSLQVTDSGVMSESTMLWVKFADRSASDDDERALPADGGPYAILAKLLFKLNNYRPGAVEGWYVVVCVETDKRWAVGQLRADASRPVQVFEDLIFDSEDGARERAQALKRSEPGTSMS